MISRAWAFVKGVFASGGDVQDIPITQDLSIPNRMSYEIGLPAITSQDKSTGGQPPRRVDFNMIFQIATANLLQLQAGLYPTFDANMITTPQTGYSTGAVLWDTVGNVWVASTKNNNTDNFLTNRSFIGTSWVIIGSANFISQITQIKGIMYAANEQAANTLSLANPTMLVFYPES